MKSLLMIGLLEILLNSAILSSFLSKHVQERQTFQSFKAKSKKTLKMYTEKFPNYYRVVIIKGDSKKTSDTFLWISRLSKGLETPSWTFFNSPFRVDFKNVHFYIIW